MKMSSTVERESILDALLSKDVLSRLGRIGETRAIEYQTAQPFPHIVIDDLLPPDLLEYALREFPTPQQLRWIKYDDTHEIKLAFPVAEKMPASIRDVLYFLNSSQVLQFLEKLTGIDALIPDPYFTGGGLHQIERGGHLGVHADFNKLEQLRLERRLNLLLYLNKDWKEEYGGHLELWDRSMSECVKRVLPIFNRCVIFSTMDHSYHGHPLPLTCPEGRSRKSLATYYYTNGRPEEQESPSHSTLFKPRPGAVIKPLPRYKRVAKRIIRSLLPPIVTDTYYNLRARGKK